MFQAVATKPAFLHQEKLPLKPWEFHEDLSYFSFTEKPDLVPSVSLDLDHFFSQLHSMDRKRPPKRSSDNIDLFGNDDYVLDSLDLDGLEDNIHSNHFPEEQQHRLGKNPDTVLSASAASTNHQFRYTSQPMQQAPRHPHMNSHSHAHSMVQPSFLSMDHREHLPNQAGQGMKRSFSEKCAEIVSKKRRTSPQNCLKDEPSRPSSGAASDASASSNSGPAPLRLRPFQMEQWSKMYASLIEFKHQFGHCSVPHNYPEHPELARWVKRQRYQLKRWKQQREHPAGAATSATPASMTLERVQALERIGFVFDSHTEVWESRYRELSNYKLDHGHCNVPVNYSQNKQLASW
ncbi:MAG: hypothetical protein SGILL_009108, partial [Bacillariaceae sp.]